MQPQFQQAIFDTVFPFLAFYDNLADKTGGTRSGKVDFTTDSRQQARDLLDASNRLKAEFLKRKKEREAEAAERAEAAARAAAHRQGRPPLSLPRRLPAEGRGRGRTKAKEDRTTRRGRTRRARART